MLYSICEFLKNWGKKGRTFLMGVNGITFTRVPWNDMTFRKRTTP